MKLNKALVLLAILAGLYGFLFGFNVGIIAGALPFIKLSFDYTPATEGLIAAAVPLGAIFGVVMASFYCDRIGRRGVLVYCAAAFLLGAIVAGLVPNQSGLIIARAVLGAATGASALAATMLLAELAPASIRGAIVTTFQLLISIGILTSYGVSLGLASHENWRLMLMIGAVPAVIALIGTMKSPESPRWLVLTGKRGQARNAISTLEPNLPSAEVDKAVEAIDKSLTAANAFPPWSVFLDPKIRNLTIFAILMCVFQQLSGINVVIYYAPRIMQEAGLPGITAQLVATVGLGSLNVLMTILSMLTVDRLGRRPLLLLGFAGTTIALALMAISFSTPEPDDAILALTGLFLFMFFFAIAIGPLPWLFMSELFPMRLKARGMALASCANWSFNFLVVFSFPVVLAAVGPSVAFAIFSGFCGIGFLYSWIAAPETKGAALEDVARRLAPGHA